jgi:hypothetical protein
MSAIVQAKSSLLSGRYAIYGEIAAGGMASVLYGRLIGPAGFARPVAIKRLHPHIARNDAVVSMFIDEARICARVSHANVVPILDVIDTPGELSLVMEYVHGCTLETLVELVRERGELTPLPIAGALILGVLHGLQAAHEAKNEQGEPLQIVHRDVSPQNIIVGVDGIPRLFDFGIAKARGRLRTTPSGEVKGKLAYMAPEQLSAAPTDVRVDVYAAGVVLWELLTCRMLFEGEHESAVVHAVMYGEVIGPRALRPELSEALDAIVLRALSRDPESRFASVREMARAVERVLVPASQSEVSEWLDAFAGERLRARAEWLRELQRGAEQAPYSAAVTRPLIEARRAEGSQAPRLESDKGRARPESYTRRKQRRWLPIAALAGAGMALVLALVWPRHDSARTQSEQTVSPAAESASPPPSNADDWTDDPTRAIEARPIEDPTHEEAPAPSADGGQLERGRPAAAARPARARQEDRPAGGKARPRDCREPYVIDALGVKRWKPECL